MEPRDLPPVETMTSEELLRELVTAAREVRKALADALENVGPALASVSKSPLMRFLG